MDWERQWEKTTQCSSRFLLRPATIGTDLEGNLFAVNPFPTARMTTFHLNGNFIGTMGHTFLLLLLLSQP